jgi:tripartite-type tricarboxylate transporter receptor subunit TctC
LIVSQPPGGAYDAYARLIARHLGKHIPGAPAIVVDNMPGAGGLLAAKHLSTRARPDGLTLGMLNPTPFLGHLLKSDDSIAGLSRLHFVGSPARDLPVCVFARASGIDNVQSWRAAKTPPRMGMSGEGAGSRIYTLLLGAALHLPNRPIRGYRGSADIRFAMANGEIDGTCIGYSAVKLLWSPATDFATVLAATAVVQPGLEGVPSAAPLAANQEDRALIEKGIYAFSALLRYVALPPATARDRVLIMRRAFVETMKDAEFLAGAAKSDLPIQPITGEELEALVRSIATLPPAFAARVRHILRTD